MALVVIALGIGYAIVRFLPEFVPQDSDYSTIESIDVTEIAIMDSIEAYNAAADSLMAADTTLVAPDSTAAAPADSAATPAAPEPAPAAAAEEKQAAADPLETVDLEYLNSHRTWKRAALKSAKYRGLFDSFAKGDIKAIADADYFAAGECANKDALRAVDYMWSSFSTETQRSNELVLKRLKGKQEIDLWKLADDLARVRSPKPNTAPRPRR